MPTSEWVKTLELFLTHPILLIATFLFAVGAFGFAWWLRSHIAQGRVEALEEQLKLARSQYADVVCKASDLQARVTTQEVVISELGKPLPPPPRVEELARSNTEIQTAVTNLVTATSSLGHTLTLTGGGYLLTLQPHSGDTRRR